MSRPKLNLDLKLLNSLRKEGLGWTAIADEYQRRTGVMISRDTAKRRCNNGRNHATVNNNGYATVLRAAEGGYIELPTVFISHINQYDGALIVRLREGGLSWRAVASVYAHRTGRRICHKTAKRYYQKIKGVKK
ncbi:hypothetical protein ACFLYS_01695 [Chloroflexota bacterium]